ncbi:oxidoreductase [Pyrenochaeta sp. DS3sAY3a]|nr:oxidoreductase [Pyrenochaeta sp. DS3sAY3a]
MTYSLRTFAFITGAASGIGKATTFAFARYGIRQFGIGDINVQMLHEVVDELKSSYPDIQVLQFSLDVSSETAVNEAVNNTAKHFSRLDIAVNNAGISGPMLPTPDVDYEAWRKLFDVNLHGVWLCERAEITQMLQQENKGLRYGRGVIVNVSSIHGLGGSTSGGAAYPTSKHAVIGLTKSDSNKFACQGIRINAICPGYVETPLVAKARAASEIINLEISKTPMKRLGQVDEIADCIAFMVSPMASFMTGSALVVDG